LFETAVFQAIAAHAIERIPNQKHTAHVELDEWIVMPNHIHLILIFLEIVLSERVGTSDNVFQNAPAGSLGVVVGRYKTAVTTRINQLRQTPGGKVWQRGYYERIIRNEREWRAAQQYIQNNPTRWAEDRENLDTLLTKMTHRT
jgi:putative transposase